MTVLGWNVRNIRENHTQNAPTSYGLLVPDNRTYLVDILYGSHTEIFRTCGFLGCIITKVIPIPRNTYPLKHIT
jgi:hypothetical protein